jgi:hypothetical protein
VKKRSWSGIYIWVKVNDVYKNAGGIVFTNKGNDENVVANLYRHPQKS